MSGNNMGLECSLRRRTDHWRITGQIHGWIFGYGILLECRSRVPHGTLGEQLRHETSPEGSTRHAWGTIKPQNVARGCGAARSSDVLGLECRSGSWARTEASASYFKVYSTTKAVEGGTMVESEIWTGAPVRTLRPVVRSEAISE